MRGRGESNTFMNQKELKELIDFLVEKDITEFELERGDLKVRVKRGTEPAVVHMAAPVPVAPAAVPVASAAPAAAGAPPQAAAPAAPAEPAEEPGLHIVKSPIV